MAQQGMKGTADFARGERFGVADAPGWQPNPLSVASGPYIQKGARVDFATIVIGGAAPFRYRLVGAAPGVKVNPFTGEVTGTPMVPAFTIEVTDDWLSSAQVTISGYSVGAPIELTAIAIASLQPLAMLSADMVLVGRADVSLELAPTYPDLTKELAGLALAQLTNSSSLLAEDEIAGSAALSLFSYGALSVDWQLAGSTSMSLAASGSLPRPLSGQADMRLVSSADLGNNKALAGSTTMSLTTNAPLLTERTFAGSSNMALTASGALAASRELTGSSQASLTPVGMLSRDKLLSGTSSLTLSASGAAVLTRVLTGTATAALSATGAATLVSTVRRVRTASGSQTVPTGKTSCTAHLLARGADATDDGGGSASSGRGGDMQTGITFAVTAGQTVSYTINSAGIVTLTYAGTTRGVARNDNLAGNGGTRFLGGAGASDIVERNSSGGGGAGTTGNGGAGSNGGPGGVRGTGVSFTDTETGTVYQNGVGGANSVAPGYGGGAAWAGGSPQNAGLGLVVLEYN